jgi:cation:H+ antiporter
MLGVAVLLWPVLRDLTVSRLDGILLLVVFAVLVIHTVRTARAEGADGRIEELHVAIEPTPTVRRDILYILLGFITLAVGARATISGAVTLGSRIGLSDAVIGSTIVAVGTSLPELVTSVVAAVKGHHDISVGNLVGSNIFNTIFVTGIAGLVHPFAVAARFAGGADYWIMIGVSLAFMAAAVLGGRTIRRPGGVALIILYGAYLIYLLRSTGMA